MGVAKGSLDSTVRYLALNLGPEGTRGNAISAGPIKTLAASGVGNFRKMLSTFQAAAPLRRNVTIEDVGTAAAFMCSDLEAGITGEITYVDAGSRPVGLPGLHQQHTSPQTMTRKPRRCTRRDFFCLPQSFSTTQGTPPYQTPTH